MEGNKLSREEILLKSRMNFIRTKGDREFYDKTILSLNQDERDLWESKHMDDAAYMHSMFGGLLGLHRFYHGGVGNISVGIYMFITTVSTLFTLLIFGSIVGDIILFFLSPFIFIMLIIWVNDAVQSRSTLKLDKRDELLKTVRLMEKLKKEINGE